MRIRELVEEKGPVDTKVVDDFVAWVADKIDLEGPPPKITFSTSTKTAQAGHHTGKYNPETGELWVYAAHRNLVDILRTVAHELTHVRQHQLQPEFVTHGPGSPHEVNADEVAGYLMKLWIRDHHNTIQ